MTPSLSRRMFDGNSSYRYATRYFLRGLGIIYLFAFASLWTQIHGLIGAHGMMPVAHFLANVKERIGPSAYWELPTLCWFNTSDRFLDILCGCGALFSILFIFGVMPALITFLLWALYLSLTIASQLFLGFQWDNLLLEAGFLAVFLAPLTMRLRPNFKPSSIIIFLFKWFLFRLMFSSGVVKLASGDEAWRNLTALNYHYWTQPLPTWTAWYIDKLPAAFDKFSTLMMFIIELVLPFFIFAPRRFRYFACFGFIFLQVFIAVTGNYCFFNILSILMCLFLLDDAWFEKTVDHPTPQFSRLWPAFITLPVFVVVFTVSLFILGGTLHLRIPWPKPMVTLYEWTSPFRSINGYGLFAVMTKSREEIIVQGSNDAERWSDYEFKWKPGDVKQRPGFVAPHQPRLDWQMWFAALGNVQGNTWLVNFMVRLLQGEKEVLALIKNNPFAEKPPKFIRAVVYDYTFTTYEERKKTGAWWNRAYKGLYCPPIQLQHETP